MCGEPVWRFTKNNGITEGFHNKMETISRQAFGFRNFENYRQSSGTMWLMAGVALPAPVFGVEPGF
jgi:hypothetical protein